jgi:ribosomal protein L11 methyltransferase
MWSVTVHVPAGAAAIFQRAFESACEAVALDEMDGGRSWRVVGYCADEPAKDVFDLAAHLAAAASGIAPPPIAVMRVPETDWLAKNRDDSPPLRISRYCLYRGHHAKPGVDGRIALRIEASLAFGTGLHGSTQACLIALGRLARRLSPRHVLDLGCGSGILALAAARTWPAHVVATDIDPVAVRFARMNAAANGLAMRIVAACGPELRPVPEAPRHFDLILANIVAAPLAAMAPRLMRRLDRGGRAVLSGLTQGDEAGVMAAYRAQGGVLFDRILRDSWTALVVGWGGPSRKLDGMPTRRRRNRYR